MGSTTKGTKTGANSLWSFGDPPHWGLLRRRTLQVVTGAAELQYDKSAFVFQTAARQARSLSSATHTISFYTGSFSFKLGLLGIRCYYQ